MYDISVFHVYCYIAYTKTHQIMSNNAAKASKYLELARFNADLFSKDKHTKVGALLLKPDFSAIIATGINGFPRKMPDEDPLKWERPTKYSYVTHAEVNAVANAARTGTSTDGCVAVVTLFPCKDCTKIMIQAGVKTLYTVQPDLTCERWGSEFAISLEMLQAVGIDVVYL